MILRPDCLLHILCHTVRDRLSGLDNGYTCAITSKVHIQYTIVMQRPCYYAIKISEQYAIDACRNQYGIDIGLHKFKELIICFLSND